jgi:hypothetical protein
MPNSSASHTGLDGGNEEKRIAYHRLCNASSGLSMEQLRNTGATPGTSGWKAGGSRKGAQGVDTGMP